MHNTCNLFHIWVNIRKNWLYCYTRYNMLQLLSSFLYDANRFNLLGQPSINSNASMYNDYDAMKGWQCFDVQDTNDCTVVMFILYNFFRTAQNQFNDIVYRTLRVIFRFQLTLSLFASKRVDSHCLYINKWDFIFLNEEVNGIKIVFLTSVRNV